jgi:hypothetical protein
MEHPHYREGRTKDHRCVPEGFAITAQELERDHGFLSQMVIVLEDEGFQATIYPGINPPLPNEAGFLSFDSCLFRRTETSILVRYQNLSNEFSRYREGIDVFELAPETWGRVRYEEKHKGLWIGQPRPDPCPDHCKKVIVNIAFVSQIDSNQFLAEPDHLWTPIDEAIAEPAG